VAGCWESAQVAMRSDVQRVAWIARVILLTMNLFRRSKLHLLDKTVERGVG
jgi:hypothetical protein